MFNLTNLNKTVFKTRKRVGRGEGSNRGKNSGKGHKGQTKHGGKVPIGFEGGQKRLMKKTPKFKGFKQSENKSRIQLNLFILERYFTNGDTVNISTLLEKDIITKFVKKVRIINSGTLTKKLNIEESDSIYLTKGVKKVVN